MKLEIKADGLNVNAFSLMLKALKEYYGDIKITKIEPTQNKEGITETLITLEHEESY